MRVISPSGGIEQFNHGLMRVGPKMLQTRLHFTTTSAFERLPDHASTLFSDQTVDVLSLPSQKPKSASALVSSGSFEKRPYADEMPIIKHSTGASLAEGGLRELLTPGKMHSTALYVVDVMALPRENSLAVFGLGARVVPASSNASLSRILTTNVEEELANLPMALLGTKQEHTLKCGIIKANVADGNCVGGTQVLLCRVVGVDIVKELNLAAKASSQALAVQLGSEVVNVSTRTLSAAHAGQWVSRRYRYGDQARNSGTAAGDHLRASVVIPLYGDTPPYLAETMRYFEMSGMQHVYLGLFDQKVPGEVRAQVEPFSSKGFVTVLETDDWPGLHFDSTPGVPVEVWKTVINDWALYHAKSWDDLLLVHDYDELVVPTQGNTVASVVENLLRNESLDLHELCYFSICPVITYGEESLPINKRRGFSRAEDFTFMDGGNPSVDFHANSNDHWNFCKRGGYVNIYPKAIAVVETSYKTTVHQPGACSALHHDPFNGERLGFHKDVPRDTGLIVQHTAELREPGRYVNHQNVKVASAFTQIWGPRLKQ
jgi:hypothetical protein